MFNNNFLKKLNILFIESKKEDRDYFSNILDNFFNSMNFCSSAKEGIDSFIEKKEEYFIDMIICDKNLDDLSGIEVLKQIRKIDEGIPFILTSDKIEVDDLLTAIKFNAIDYFEKPINGKDLLFCIEKNCFNRYSKRLKTLMQFDLEDLSNVVNEVALLAKTDNKCNITYANNYLCEISGFNKDELLNENYQILNNENHSIIREIEEKVNQGITWEGKLKNISKEKDEFYLYLTVLPIHNKIDSKIMEFMWISFLTTEEEIEEKEFKKKIKKNMYSNRRINIEAREKIDFLMAKIKEYETIKSSFLSEKQKSSKFNSQIIFYEKELVPLEGKLEEIRKKVGLKIKPILEKEKKAKEQKEKKLLSLSNLNKKSKDRTETIEELKENLSIQLAIIKRLKLSIDELD
jgi:PAS domain S-box-containing protein